MRRLKETALVLIGLFMPIPVPGTDNIWAPTMAIARIPAGWVIAAIAAAVTLVMS